MMLSRTISAESYKLRRTPALLLAASVPLLICVLYLLLFNFAGSYRNLSEVQFWEQLLGISNFLWNTLMLQMGIAVLGGLVVGIEHTENQWKTLLTLPPSRVSIYLAKILVVAGLVLFGSMVLLFGLTLVGLLQTNFATPHWTGIFDITIRAWFTALPLMALHVWYSSRFKSFAVPLGLGFAGTLTAMFTANADGLIWIFVPWAYPSTDLIAKYGTLTLGLSSVVFIVVTALGAWDFSRRDMQ